MVWRAKDTIPPTIEIRKRFKPFVEDELPSVAKGTMALVAHPYSSLACPHDVNCAVTLVIGPEGALFLLKIELLEKNGFQAVTLRPRILRVENAIPALAGRLFLIYRFESILEMITTRAIRARTTAPAITIFFFTSILFFN